jgi:hypothetical protein
MAGLDGGANGYVEFKVDGKSDSITSNPGPEHFYVIQMRFE